MFSFPFSVLLLSSLLLPTSLCAEHRINNAGEFIDFSKSVNSGTNYSGTTVLLDSDLDFSGGYSEQFESIGYSSAYCFNGVFDGQGCVFSNVKINSSTAVSFGLFGYSSGTTIQDVVIDGSCSFTSYFSSETYYEYACFGSVIGFCSSTGRRCEINGVVNMGTVGFDGNAHEILSIGGIAGGVSVYNYPNSLKNCVNYGSITYTGSCYVAEIGGIVGSSDIQYQITEYSLVQNCLNYGAITHNGKFDDPAMGGIAGNSMYTVFENCVNSGTISSNKENGYIGAILGGITTDTKITHCFWTSVVGNASAYGYKSSSVNVTESSLVTLNQTTLDELNRYVGTKDGSWSKWVMLYLNGGRINNISQESLVEIQSHFPDPVKEGNTFLFWYKDADCTEVFDLKTDDVSALYAGWKINNYTVTFDFGNGTVVNATFKYNEAIVYPSISEKEGHSLKWDPNPEAMPARDIIITAQWVISNYAVTFDFGNGTVKNETFAFNTTIEYPSISEREGHTFNGWNSKPDFMPAKNIIITAQWMINNYIATFDFGNGNVANATIKYNETIEYPSISEKEGHTSTWDPKYETMPAKDVTITAVWIPNNYTVTFDFGNGTMKNEILAFNATIEYPNISEREGYIFNGWDNKPETMPARDITVKVLWTEAVDSKAVEIVFDTKDLKSKEEEEMKEEISKIIKTYTDELFVIEHFEDDPTTGEVKVVIKFANSEKAMEFVRVVNEEKRTDASIKRVKSVAEIHTNFCLPREVMSVFALIGVVTFFFK